MLAGVVLAALTLELCFCFLPAGHGEEAAGRDTQCDEEDTHVPEPQRASGMQMGAHCVWSNDSGTDIEALRLDFPDSFPPESAEDDMHDTTPEVPIPCMAQLLEMEIRACEDAPATTCRCSCSCCIIAIRISQPDDPPGRRLMVGSVPALQIVGRALFRFRSSSAEPARSTGCNDICIGTPCMLWCLSRAPTSSFASRSIGIATHG